MRKRYKFDYPESFVTLAEYSAHRGLECEVVRPLIPTHRAGDKGEYDFEFEAMFLVKFDDGFTAHAYRSELAPLIETAA